MIILPLVLLYRTKLFAPYVSRLLKSILPQPAPIMAPKLVYVPV